MNLKDAIDKIKTETKKSTKLSVLKKYESEIKEMISIGLPLKKQIELILEHTEIDKLQYSEYYNILKKEFGYTGKKNKKVFEYKGDKLEKTKSTSSTKKSASEILSEDVDLLDNHLKKISRK